MSAYIVTDSNINKIISGLNGFNNGDQWVYSPLTKAGIVLDESLGHAMFVLNCMSIEERYGPGSPEEFSDLDYKYQYVIPPPPIQLIKSLGCFLYQSCEGECEHDELYNALQDVERNLALYIVHRSPQYDKAMWG